MLQQREVRFTSSKLLTKVIIWSVNLEGDSKLLHLKIKPHQRSLWIAKTVYYTLTHQTAHYIFTRQLKVKWTDS